MERVALLVVDGGHCHVFHTGETGYLVFELIASDGTEWLVSDLAPDAESFSVASDVRFAIDGCFEGLEGAKAALRCFLRAHS